jgi:hypothetical protein
LIDGSPKVQNRAKKPNAKFPCAVALILTCYIGAQRVCAQANPAPEEACTDEPCRRAWSFWHTGNQQMDEARSAKGEALQLQYQQNYFVYLLAGCDEIEGSQQGSNPHVLRLCATVRAEISEQSGLAKMTIEQRALHIRLAPSS